MNAAEIISDFASRPVDAIEGLGDLTAEQLLAHPGDHPNSISWLLWHSARQADVQLNALTDVEEVWTRLGYREEFDLGEIGDTFGLGHSPEQAAQIQVTDLSLLTRYLAAVLGELSAYAASLSPEDLDEVIDHDYTPHVTRGTRIVSIIDDAQQHVGAAMHVAGTVTGRAVGPA